jgi:pimeloyl-ACP methyl ester carboxylesterase
MRRESMSAGDPAFPTATLAVGNTSLRWSDSQPGGRGGGRPLLLINGIGANLEMWNPLRRALTRRTIAYDALGTGDSGTPAHVVDMASMATVASRVLDAAGVSEVDVLGYSFGGFVSQELARADDRVSRLVLAATSAGWSTSPTDLRELGGRSAVHVPLALGIMLTPTRYHLSPSGQRLIRRVFGDGGGGNYTTADRARAQRPPRSVGYWYQLAAASRWSSRSWLDQLTMPALVLSGQRDTICTVAAGEYLATHLRHGRQVVVPKAGHSFLLREQQDDVAPIIEGFLDDGEVKRAA